MKPQVHLVPFAPAHFDRLIAWSPTPEFLMQWAGPSLHFPLDPAQLHELMAQPGMRYTAVEDERVVGHGEIGRIDREAKTGWLTRILVGDPEDRRRGLGRAIVEQLLGIAFEEAGLERVYLHVLKSNAPAIGLYRSFGFENCAPVLPRPDTIQPMVLARADHIHTP